MGALRSVMRRVTRSRMGFGLFTSTFLGIGFLWKGGIGRASAALLLVAPVLLVIGQGGDDTIAWWQVNLFYPLACLAYLAALAPLGLRMLDGEADREIETVALAPVGRPRRSGRGPV